VGFTLEPLGREDLVQNPLERGHDRSPLEYTNCGVCISSKRKVCSLEESFGFH
jgi:hypothetical protein